jgi:hypothetical protein
VVNHAGSAGDHSVVSNLPIRSVIYAAGAVMRITLLFFLILTCAVVSAAQVRSKCFRSEWLQGERSVNLTISGNKVTGTFTVEAADESSPRVYSFRGTLRGSKLTVAFAGNKLPDISPSALKGSIWRLVKHGNRESLRIKVFGKNYDTNKYEESFADFESCDTRAKSSR